MIDVFVNEKPKAQLQFIWSLVIIFQRREGGIYTENVSVYAYILSINSALPSLKNNYQTPNKLQLRIEGICL